MEIKECKLCDICTKRAVKVGKDSAGKVYRACAEHAQYLLGWIRDANSEMRADAIASRRYEDAAYGWD